MSERRRGSEQHELRAAQLDMPLPPPPVHALRSEALAVAHEDVLVVRLIIYLVSAGSRAPPGYATAAWLTGVRWAQVSPPLRRWAAACCAPGAVEAGGSLLDVVFPNDCRAALAAALEGGGCGCSGDGGRPCHLHAAPRPSYAFSTSARGAALFAGGGPFFLWFNPGDALGARELAGQGGGVEGAGLSPSGTAHPLPPRYERNVRAWCGAAAERAVLGARDALAAVREAACHPVFRGGGGWLPVLQEPEEASPRTQNEIEDVLYFCDLLAPTASPSSPPSPLLTAYLACASDGRWIQSVDTARLAIGWLYRLAHTAACAAGRRLGAFVAREAWKGRGMSGRLPPFPLPSSPLPPPLPPALLLYLDTDTEKGPDPLPAPLLPPSTTSDSTNVAPLPPALLLPRDADGVLQNNAVGVTCPAHPLLALALAAAALSVAEEGRVVHSTGPALLTALWEAVKTLPVAVAADAAVGGGSSIGAALADCGLPAAAPDVAWLRGVPKLVGVGAVTSDSHSASANKRLVPLGALVHVCPAPCFYASHWREMTTAEEEEKETAGSGSSEGSNGKKQAASASPSSSSNAAGTSPPSRLPRYAAHGWDCTWGAATAVYSSAVAAYLVPSDGRAAAAYHGHMYLAPTAHPYHVYLAPGSAATAADGTLALSHPYTASWGMRQPGSAAAAGNLTAAALHVQLMPSLSVAAAEDSADALAAAGELALAPAPAPVAAPCLLLLAAASCCNSGAATMTMTGADLGTPLAPLEAGSARSPCAAAAGAGAEALSAPSPPPSAAGSPSTSPPPPPAAVASREATVACGSDNPSFVVSSSSSSSAPPRPSLLHIPPILHDLYGLVFGCSPLATTTAGAAESPTSPPPPPATSASSGHVPGAHPPTSHLQWVVELPPSAPPAAWAEPPVRISPRSAAAAPAIPTRLILAPYLSRQAVEQALTASSSAAVAPPADPRDVFSIGATAVAVLGRLWGGGPGSAALLQRVVEAPIVTETGAACEPADEAAPPPPFLNQ